MEAAQGVNAELRWHKAEVVNCYNVYLTIDDGNLVLVEGIDGDTLCIRHFKNDDVGSRAFENHCNKYPLTNALSQNFLINHCGSSKASYKGIRNLLIGETLLMQYFGCKVLSAKNWVRQAFFNRKKLVSYERFEFLKHLLDMNKKEKNVYVSTDILRDKYERNWKIFCCHPMYDEISESTEFMLNMFVKTGDVEESESNPSYYSVTGNGILAITQFEEDERKHKESMAYQRGLVIVTIVLAGTGILQIVVSKFS